MWHTHKTNAVNLKPRSSWSSISIRKFPRNWKNKNWIKPIFGRPCHRNTSWIAEGHFVTTGHPMNSIRQGRTYALHRKVKDNLQMSLEEVTLFAAIFLMLLFQCRHSQYAVGCFQEDIEPWSGFSSLKMRQHRNSRSLTTQHGTVLGTTLWSCVSGSRNFKMYGQTCLSLFFGTTIVHTYISPTPLAEHCLVFTHDPCHWYGTLE